MSPKLKPRPPAKKPATYADLEALPANLVGEILDGELIASPRPRPRHSFATMRLGGELDAAFGGPGGGGGKPGGWAFFVEPELHFGAKGQQVLVPDLAGYRRERLPELPEEAYFTLAPDWVCEVISDGTRRYDRGPKMRIYARAGVKHIWLLEPVDQSLEVYRLEKDKWLLLDTYGDEGKKGVRAEPFDAVALDPRRWWFK